eukprot:TRINITY_DN13023_c0_g1_i1.p1 TRINITY_DN13023_c0_g1~~TRINITY_DN13023_c0_g1_i1.p1  ORF type:complete len:302 (-),score=74.21 TRINITY_DN13023_c0_g1_i1:75-980(-)
MSNRKNEQLLNEANDLFVRGETKLNEFVMPLFGSRSAKYEQAADIFAKAANTYKRAKHYNEATGAFKKAAECHLRLNQKYDAASLYIKASSMAAKESVPKSAELIHRAIELFMDEGRFTIAAKHHHELGEIYEAEGDLVRAKEEYATAAEYYEDEGNPATGRKSLIKVAEICGTLGEYNECAEIYERIGRDCASVELTTYSAKKHFFNAGIALLCTLDVIAVNRALDNYCNLSTDFARSMEYKLLEGLSDALEQVDPKAFSKASAEFDSITSLNPWQTNLLVKVKESILEQEEDSSLDDLK